MNNYYTEETAEKLVKIGFYETVQYFKVINKVKEAITKTIKDFIKSFDNKKN